MAFWSWRKIDKRAGAYCRAGFILLHPESSSGVSVPPYVKLDRTTDPALVGKTIIDILAEAGKKIPWPKDWQAVRQPFWDLVGVRSEKAFMEGTRCCLISFKDDRFRFEPLANIGHKEGFVSSSQNDLDITLPKAASEEELGRALLTAFERCE